MAGFIPEDKIDEVRSAANIIDVVSQHLSLKKAGRNLLGLCPFHAEKTPSFTVNEEKQIFHCFGCGQGGNVFSFLMLYHNIEFPEAVRMVADKYGIHVTTKGMSSGQRRRLEQKDGLFRINQLAVGFFKDNLLKGSSGKPAREYLRKRRIIDGIIEEFSLGYAPAGWDNLIRYFSSSGISLSDVEKAGLIIPKKQGYYDRFRARIIFPIVDIRGKVVGFGGRCLDNSLPKYLNSPETLVYHKGRTLYGLSEAKQVCRQKDSVFVVEGYFDLLALNCHGIHNVVATLGTALTGDHIRILKGYAGQIILVFDSDKAGVKAAERSLPLFVAEKVEARIMSLPAGKDPDSYIQESGGEKFLSLAEQALPIMGFIIESAINRYGLSLEGKVRIIEALKGPLGYMTNSVARAVYVKELSKRLDIDESAILERIRRSNHKKDKTRNPSVRFAANSLKLEETLIAMVLQSPNILSRFNAEQVIESIQSLKLKKIGRMVLDRYSANRLSEGADLVVQTEDPEIRNLISSLLIMDKSWDQDNCLKVVRQYETCLRKKHEKLLSKKIKDAEEANDEVLLHRLLTEKQKNVLGRLKSLGQ